MAWIESHQALQRHPKTLKLADGLSVHRGRALGLLHSLWYWAIDYAPSGSLAKTTDAELVVACDWEGDPSVLRPALRTSGFVDPDDQLHDWDEYAGRLLSSRKRDAKRKRDVRRTSADRPPAVQRTDSTDQPNRPNPTDPTQQTKAVLLGWFDILWAMYPSKDGRKAAEKHFLGTVRTTEDHAKIQKALGNYLASDRVRNGYVKNGSTWFNNWADWVDHVEIPKGGANGKPSNSFRADGPHAAKAPPSDAVVL